SYVNLKIATCLVRYADDRLIDQRFLSEGFAFNRPVFTVIDAATGNGTTRHCATSTGRHHGIRIVRRLSAAL
ncbi:hypothetical protein, partial [Burkholderia multivorans]|uniref:hypothetical protein n=1 Tax=Burkholderia multivorans TaxID=87883 RepID=UPI001C6158BF